MTSLFVALLPVFFLASAGEKAEVVRNQPEVEFRDGRMSVRAADVRLKDLLDEIGGKGKIEIELKDAKAAEKSVSVDLKDVIPGRALREILHGLNYAFFYSQTRLSRVVIVPPGTPIVRSPGGRIAGGKGVVGNFPAKREARRKPERDSAVEAKLAAIEAWEESEDPKSIDELGKALADQNAEVKSAALNALADKEGANVNQALRRGLNDPSPEFRIEVLEALAERGDLDALRKALSDPSPEVKEAVADLLEDAKEK